MRRGRRSRCRMDAAATASGGATMAPSAIAAAQGRPGISALATAAMHERGEQHRAHRQQQDRAAGCP